MRKTTALFLLLALTGCGIDSTGASADEAYLNAEVSFGRVASDESPMEVIEHRGDGFFSGGTYARELRMFNISSRDDALGSLVVLYLHPRGTGPVSTGDYTLSPVYFRFGAQPGSSSMVFVYDQKRYLSERGSLRLTHVSEDRVEGTFAATAVFWCHTAPAADHSACYSMPSITDASERVRVEGSFSAESRPPATDLAGGS